MADPHNEQRYGETWPQHRIDAYMEVLRDLRPHVVFSGGWAWHFMSPEGHTEYKHAHDHKDVDLMVPKRTVATVMGILLGLGFKRVTTKYDRLSSVEEFRRYEKVVPHYLCGNCSWSGPEDRMCPQCGHKDMADISFRITIDFFVRDVSVLQCPGGWLVVRPDQLLTFYSTLHGSKAAWSVQAAAIALQRGASPEDLLGWSGLVMAPGRTAYRCRKCGWVSQFPEQRGNLLICGGCGKYALGRGFKPPMRP